MRLRDLFGKREKPALAADLIVLRAKLTTADEFSQSTARDSIEIWTEIETYLSKRIRSTFTNTYMHEMTDLLRLEAEYERLSQPRVLSIHSREEVSLIMQDRKKNVSIILHSALSFLTSGKVEGLDKVTPPTFDRRR